MGIHSWKLLSTIIPFVLCLFLLAGQRNERLTMEQVMTPDEMKATGISGLLPQQRKALDLWLNRYSVELFSAKNTSSDCDPAIETQVDGSFNGWTGETVYKLRNGQIWQQASYHYHYHYAYAPDVTIYSTEAGCSIRVADDDDEAVSVRRLK